jgi:hypothetical protein
MVMDAVSRLGWTQGSSGGGIPTMPLEGYSNRYGISATETTTKGRWMP